MNKPPDSSGGRLRRAEKLILDWLLSTPSGAKAAPASVVDPSPEEAAPPRFTPILERVEPRPLPPVVSEEEATLSGPRVIYQALRERILDGCGLLRSVKEEMAGLADSYRCAVPPTRLQLCAWGFPRGTPPRALYWVRLARRQEEVCDDHLQVRSLQRPRWFRRLKIRTREDLRNAIHWNGLDAHKSVVLRYHELASCLNRAHCTLSRRSAHLVLVFGRKFGGVGVLPGCPDLPLEAGDDGLRIGAGSRLLRCAWRIQWAVDTELSRWNGLTGGPIVRLEARRTAGNRACERFVWVNGPARMAALLPRKGRSAGSGRDESPAERRAELMRLLDARMKIVN